MVKTPAEKITDIADALPAQVDALNDPAKRAKTLRDAAEATSDLAARTASLYGSAVRDLVAQVGATEAARLLGVSRNRVYQIQKHA